MEEINELIKKNGLESRDRLILRTLADSITDWDSEILNLNDFEFEIVQFIGLESTIVDRIILKNFIRKQNPLLNTWKIESLESLRLLFEFFPDDKVSLSTIFEIIKTKFNL